MKRAKKGTHIELAEFSISPKTSQGIFLSALVSVVSNKLNYIILKHSL